MPAFANKWKTREVCQDVSLVEPNHPCQVNAHYKPEAEKYCQAIKSSLFESRKLALSSLFCVCFACFVGLNPSLDLSRRPFIMR